MDTIFNIQNHERKYRLWHCERCRINWIYDPSRDEVDNWHSFITHTDANGRRCQSYPIKTFITGSTASTDIRILL